MIETYIHVYIINATPRIIPSKHIHYKEAHMYVKYDQAQALLEEAYKLNPGKWRDHSKNVAYAARVISEHVDGLDPEKAYSFGLLHDIGRIRGIKHMKHVVDGFEYLSAMGFNENARICMTHSFPIKVVASYSGNNDCTPQEIKFISDFLISIDYDDYDKLIQLCDALALPDSICILEKRLVDVAIRNGVNEYTVEKWKAFLALKSYFDAKVGMNIYNLFNLG